MDPEYVDTGLGWSAKADYLVFSDGVTVGSYGGYYYNNGQYPEQPVPVTGSTGLDITSRGVLVAESNMYAVYMGTDTANSVFSVVSQQASNWIVPGAFAPSNTAQVFVCVKNKSSGSLGSVMTFTPNSGIGTYLGGPWYVGYASSTPMGGGLSIKCPTSTSAVNNISFSGASITKTNEGWAVACMAKWKTSADVIFNTPVLISSVSEYTDMTLNDATHNIAKLNILHSGVRFYMSFFDITDTTPVSSELPLFDMSGSDDPALTLEDVFKFIASIAYAGIRIYHAPDPYSEEGAGSGEEGGDGEDLEDDEMGISHHAIPAAINTGFCRIYCPSEQQLRDLSNFLWSAQYDLTAVKKLFANPMDSVLGLSAVPLTLSGANMPVYLGGVDTEMSFPMVSYQSYQVPMGAITVEKRWGSYLDYDPYTKFSIYLPFIGFKDLSADDIMGKQIILDYDVDILSGACTARLQAGGNVLYQWSGQCSIQLPVTASNWNQVFQNATSAALTAGLAVATGSAGPVLAGALAAEGAQAIMGKPRIERGGTASGAAGWMGGLTPYLVRVTPQAVIPNNQNMFIGYPAFSSISLGALSGYNEISSIHLEGIPATGAELDELEAILKGGVIF